jgi:hypothetical protein
MRGAWSDLRQAIAAEKVRLDAGKSARLPLGVVGRLLLDRLLRTRCAIYVVETPRERSWTANPPGSGECRIKYSPRSCPSFCRTAAQCYHYCMNHSRNGLI